MDYEKLLKEKQEEHDQVVADIMAIADTATSEKRAITDDEHVKATEGYAKVKALREEIEQLNERKSMSEKILNLGKLGGPVSTDEAKVVKAAEAEARKTVGRQFVEADAYKSLRARGMSGNWTTGPIEIKAATLTSDAASGGDLIGADERPGILPLLFRRLTVADLMPNGTTTSNTVRVLKETTATNAADTVAEGAAKPEATLIFDAVDEPVRKIAVLLPVTDEMLEDEEQIRTYIDNRLRLFVQLAEEDQLLNGSGVAPDLTGILNRAGIQTQALGADTRLDAIFKAGNLIRTNAFLEADGLVINPADWEQVRLQKDADNNYMGGGAFGNSAFAPPLWGFRTVVTPAIAAGTALVGAFATAAQVFRRSGITVEASNSHASNFAENKTTIRAEERMALAVYRPAAFATVTGI